MGIGRFFPELGCYLFSILEWSSGLSSLEVAYIIMDRQTGVLQIQDGNEMQGDICLIFEVEPICNSFLIGETRVSVL